MKKALRIFGVALAVGMIPYLVKMGDDSSLEVRALLWSVKKTPGEEQDTYTAELLPLL